MQTDVGRFMKFVALKTRVALIQGWSIPRLELLTALLLARLVSSISDCLAPQLSLGLMKLSTDSKVALFRVQSDKEWKQFVQNRSTKSAISLQPSAGATALAKTILLMYHEGV